MVGDLHRLGELGGLDEPPACGAAKAGSALNLSISEDAIGPARQGSALELFVADFAFQKKLRITFVKLSITPKQT